MLVQCSLFLFMSMFVPSLKLKIRRNKICWWTIILWIQSKDDDMGRIGALTSPNFSCIQQPQAFGQGSYNQSGTVDVVFSNGMLSNGAMLNVAGQQCALVQVAATKFVARGLNLSYGTSFGTITNSNYAEPAVSVQINIS